MQEGRNFLEKLSLLCPPGEPLTHEALAICMYQIAAMLGLQKQAINAIRATTFLLEEMEEDTVKEMIKEAFDNKMMELTSDMTLLIEDTKAKINKHIKTTLVQATPTPMPASTLENANTLPPTPSERTQRDNTYAAALIKPPPHVDPRLVAREGIKARQFLLKGGRKSQLGLMDPPLNLKSEIKMVA